MTRQREPDELLDAYLAEGMHFLPDRVVDAVLDEVHRTRQRAAFGPWRIQRISSTLKLALAAAAVVAVALIGITFLPQNGGFGGPGAASPSPAVSSRPTPTPIPLDSQGLTMTEHGTYLAGDPFQVPITFTAPAGWVGRVAGPYAVYLDRAPVGNGDASVRLSLSQTIYADPCHDRGFLAPQPGPTVDDLAAALASLPGFDATTPTAVTVDGYTGKQLTLTAPASFDACTPSTLSSDGYRLWQLPLGANTAFNPGQRTMFRIVDVNGKRLVVDSETYPTTNAQELAEVQEILDSIRIEKNN
jgi:hypothetical protein